MESRKKRRKTPSSSESSSEEDSPPKRGSSSKKKKRVKKHKRVSSSSETTSTDVTSSDSELERKRLKKKEKRSKKKNKKERSEEPSSDIPLDLMTKSKTMAPITKEEWEKRQNVVRRVYDESTGRHRLIKGDGEVIEEMVSRDRHKAINQQATRGDGAFFEAQMSGKLKK